MQIGQSKFAWPEPPGEQLELLADGQGDSSTACHLRQTSDLDQEPYGWFAPAVRFWPSGRLPNPRGPRAAHLWLVRLDQGPLQGQCGVSLALECNPNEQPRPIS